jgi:SOS-response transcriptional repressor LexA
MLKVKGESMIDAGILPGDMVIVERGKEPKIGEIVIAEVDGDYTMKYYRKDKSGRVFLEPANERFQNIYPENNLEITAVVRSVIRKF